jgi:HK97 gp10 family phage protein
MARMLPNGRAAGTSYSAKPRWLGVEDTVKRLKNLSTELSGKNGGPIRRALGKAAKVIEHEAERRVQKVTGRLERNIISMRVRNPKDQESAQGVILKNGGGSSVEMYRVGVRGGGRYGAKVRQRERKKVYAMGGSIRQAERAAKASDKDAYYWWFLENGTSKMPAQPYLRPAFDMKKDEALQVFTQELDKDVRRLEQTVK